MSDLLLNLTVFHNFLQSVQILPYETKKMQEKSLPFLCRGKRSSSSVHKQERQEMLLSTEGRGKRTSRGLLPS